MQAPQEDRTPALNAAILSLRFVTRLRVADQKNKVEPFVGGGYSAILRQHVENDSRFGTTPRTWHAFENGVNFGGGIHWWFAKHVGLRLEVRDYVSSSDGTTHLVSGYMGLAFR